MQIQTQSRRRRLLKIMVPLWTKKISVKQNGKIRAKLHLPIVSFIGDILICRISQKTGNYFPLIKGCSYLTLNWNFYFYISFLCLSFIKALKAFIKLLEAPQRSVKLKIEVYFLSSSGIGTESINNKNTAEIGKM